MRRDKDFREAMRKISQRMDRMMSEPRPEVARPMTDDGYQQMNASVRRCPAKLSFRSKAAVAKWIKAHPRAGDMVKVYPYECPRCGDWHTSSSRPR